MKLLILGTALLLLPLAAAATTFNDGSYAGDGSDGAVTRSVNANENVMVQATTYKINQGVTMTTGLGARTGIIIYATNEIIIEGTLSANGNGALGQAADAGAVQTVYGFGGNRGTCAVPPPGGNGGAHGEMASVSSNMLVFQGLFPSNAGGSGGGGGLTATAITTCGGGGGAGATRDGGDGSLGGASTGVAGVTGPGGSGGGFILLVSPKITLGATGVITSNGTAGTAATANSGAAGGGAGGIIYLVTEQLTFNGTNRVYVTGGNGGASAVGPGGVGGLRGQSGVNSVNNRAGGGGAGGEIIQLSPTEMIGVAVNEIIEAGNLWAPILFFVLAVIWAEIRREWPIYLLAALIGGVAIPQVWAEISNLRFALAFSVVLVLILLFIEKRNSKIQLDSGS